MTKMMQVRTCITTKVRMTESWFILRKIALKGTLLSILEHFGRGGPYSSYKGEQFQASTDRPDWGQP